MDESEKDYEMMIGIVSSILHYASKNNKGVNALLVILFSSIAENVFSNLKNKKSVELNDLIVMLSKSLDYNSNQLKELLKTTKVEPWSSNVTVH